MRQPYLPRFMAGGETNPLGARARSLSWQDGVSHHGTNQPSTIGTFVSSGCIRPTNDVIDLYHHIQVGTRVVVLPGRPPATAAATSLAPLAVMPSQAAPPAPPSVVAR